MCDALEQALERAKENLENENTDWWWASAGVVLAGASAIGAAGAVLIGSGGTGAYVSYGIALAGGVVAGDGMEDAWNEYEAAEAAYADALEAYCDCVDAQ
ncbi:MAG: hypothetical protein N4A35_00045 [Flavobacteriales bacterium]|jgi:hypothetical protein|nr:hypothetical protein [Flavobacteriales bacterium]